MEETGGDGEGQRQGGSEAESQRGIPERPKGDSDRDRCRDGDRRTAGRAEGAWSV